MLLFVTLLTFAVPLLTASIPLHTDGQFVTFPIFSYFKHWALKGAYPVWWITDSLCGAMADGGPIAPAWLIWTPLLLFLRLETAWFLMILLQFFLAGVSMYFYLNHMTASRTASLLGALLFMRAEGFTDSLDEPQTQFFYLPLILLSLEKALGGLKLRYIFLAALLSTLFFIGSHANYPVYMIPLAVFYYFVRAFQRHFTQNGSDVRPFLFGVLFILLFAAWSWFRLFILANVGLLSTRETVAAMPPLLTPLPSLLTVFFPDFFKGSDIQFPYIYDRILQGFAKILFHTEARLFEIWYPGLFVIFFLCCAWTARKRTPWALGFWIVLFGWLFYIYGGEALLWPLIQKIPLVNLLRNTQRTIVISMVAVPILAAAGFQVCLNALTQSPPDSAILSRWFKRFSLFFAFLLIVFVVKDMAVLAIESFWKEPLTERILHLIRARAGFKHSQSFYLARINEFFLWLRSWANWRSPAVFLPFLLYSFGGGLFWMAKRGGSSSLTAGVLFFSLVIVDGFLAYPAPLKELVPHEHLYVPNRVTPFLQKDPSLFRFLSLKPAGEALFPLGHSQFLPAETQLVEGLSSVHGYQAVVPKRYYEVFQILARTDSLNTIRLQDIYQYDKKLADLLNVKYLVVNKPDYISDLPLVFEDSSYRVYLNSDSFPRAFLVPESIAVLNRQESLEWLRSGKLDFSKTVVLEGPGAPAIRSKPLTSNDQVVIHSYTPQEIILEVRSEDERILVLTDNHYPGWKCWVDGQPVPIYIAYHTFRGVRLGSGRHSVRFKLEPFPFRLYGLGVLSSLLLPVGIFFFLKRKET